MLQKMLESSDLNGDRYLPNTAMSATDQIFQWGDLSRLKLLFESKMVNIFRTLSFFNQS